MTCVVQIILSEMFYVFAIQFACSVAVSISAHLASGPVHCADGDLPSSQRVKKNLQGCMFLHPSLRLSSPLALLSLLLLFVFGLHTYELKVKSIS